MDRDSYILLAFSFYPDSGTKDLSSSNISFKYYNKTGEYLSKFKRICQEHGGEEPEVDFEVYDLECRGEGICENREPSKVFKNFCENIGGKGRCYSSIWYVCIPPPKLGDEFTFCRWNLWQGSGCEKINKYRGKKCETGEDCGGFPCHKGECLIRRCEEGCMDYYCASGIAQPHGYCSSYPGDV